MAGLTGSGSAFVVRDPSGIRPAYYYADEEVVVVASEKPAIKTAFNIEYDQIEEIDPDMRLIINKNGEFRATSYHKTNAKKSPAVLNEFIFLAVMIQKSIRNENNLDRLLVPQVLKSINFDLKNTIFSYIPNTAETAFYGMMRVLKIT